MSDNSKSSHDHSLLCSLLFTLGIFSLFFLKKKKQDEVSVPGSNSADLLHWTTATTMKVLSNTTTTTKAVLQAVSDGQWWKKSLTYLRPLHVSGAFCFLKAVGVVYINSLACSSVVSILLFNSILTSKTYILCVCMQ